MKQTKTFFALFCALLLFSALSFGADRNSDIQGRWTSCNPMLRYGNMPVYACPVTELDFTSYGILFIRQKNGYKETVSCYSYFYDEEELILSNSSQTRCCRWTASIEEREVLPEKELTVQGFDEDVLPNDTYFYLGAN